MGLVNLVLSSLVVFFFFVKKAPLLLKDIWVAWWESNLTKFMRVVEFSALLLNSIYICLMDFDFVYYMTYQFCLIIGLIYHPFFFGILTFDFLRINFLKNVVRAVWIPRDILSLTFLVFLLVEYWFTIIGYIFLSD